MKYWWQAGEVFVVFFLLPFRFQWVFWGFFFSLFSLFCPRAWGGEDCEKLLSSKGSVTYYLKKAETLRAGEGFGKRPTFTGFHSEMNTARSWQGEKVPRLFRKLLPNQVNFIDHPLIDATEQGVVKDVGSGDFLSLRVSKEWNGFPAGTNIGLSVFNLIGNLGSEKKYLVNPRARAAMLYIHGGGTKTTGHHVGINIINHFQTFGVDVISMDMPWHGEGPRAFFSDHMDFFRYMGDFIETYIPPEVPVFIGGHSFGGLIADMMMRASHRSVETGLDRVKGYIALSQVADPKPGGTPLEKQQAGDLVFEKLKEPEISKRVHEDDLKMFTSMVVENKVSPFPMAFVNFLQSFHDWSWPNHGGKLWTPALSIVGEADGLVYVGLEHLFANYMSLLENVEFHSYTPRKSFRSEKPLPVGHLIFDHYVPGQETPETFWLIRKFMERHLGQTFSRVKPQDMNEISGEEITSVMTLLRMFQNYANNLGFREFAKEHVEFQREPTEKLIQMSMEFKPLAQYMKKVTRALGKQGSGTKKLPMNERLARLESSRPDIQLPEGFHSYEDVSMNWSRMQKIMSSDYVPEGSQEAQFNLHQRKTLDQTLTERSKTLQGLTPKVEALAIKERGFLKEFNALLEKARSPALDEARRVSQTSLDELLKLDIRIRETQGDFYVDLQNSGRLSDPQAQMDIPEQLHRDSLAYDKATQIFKQSLMRESLVAQQEALEGRLGSQIQNLALQLYAEDGVVRELSSVQEEISQLEEEMFHLQSEVTNLMETYVTEILPGYYSVRRTPLREVLDRHWDPMDKDTFRLLSEAQKYWLRAWRRRPVGENSGGLY